MGLSGGWRSHRQIHIMISAPAIVAIVGAEIAIRVYLVSVRNHKTATATAPLGSMSVGSAWFDLETVEGAGGKRERG
jgi:hypothetical protein